MVEIGLEYTYVYIYTVIQSKLHICIIRNTYLFST